MRFAIKLYFFYFLIFFIIDLNYALGNENLILRWPSLNIISSLLKTNNLINNDFYTNSLLNTPLRTTINIFSLILPKTHLELISSFSLFSLLFKSLLPLLLIFLSTTIATIIVKDFHRGKSFTNEYYFSSLFFIGTIIFFLSKQTNIIKDIFFGTPIALWGFPTALASSRGISLFISVICLNIPLLIQLFRPNQKELNIKLLIFLFSINLIASIIHPISPIFSLIIIFLIKILFNKTLLSWFKIINIFFISFLYPQANINNLDLFRIYIENNHAHHYLPSFYLEEILKSRFLLINLFISIFFITYNYKNNFIKRTFIKLLISNFFIIIIINLNQFFLVEILKNSLFIKLGLTFLNISYNFLYFTSILIFLSLIDFNPKRLLIVIFNPNSREYKPKFLSLNLMLISLTIFTLILTRNVYEGNIIKAQNSMSFISGNKIQKLNINNSEYIIDKKFNKDIKYPRELGLINIFSDDYFPFNLGSLKSWEEKASARKAFETCLAKNSDKCFLPIKYHKKIFYLSSVKKHNLGKEILIDDIRNIPIYIYNIETR